MKLQFIRKKIDTILLFAHKNESIIIEMQHEIEVLRFKSSMVPNLKMKKEIQERKKRNWEHKTD